MNHASISVPLRHNNADNIKFASFQDFQQNQHSL